ncbi:hypothetical protein [Thermodesulfatator atlanticus]|uniref:hypothetical protein n=1 Tax=Thermodesulfatator atlanticus TaxID=501497 RepID=UPI0003B2ECEC|nr:hypothetical protein [Thermodesulfatator atlanticus]
MSKWERFKREWEKSFAAATFAEAGDYETAQNILGTNGWVVLAGKGKNISDRTVSYVKNLCVSSKSALRIVWQGSCSEELFKKKCEEIPHCIDIIEEDLRKALPAYLRSLKKINMIIFACDSPKFKSLLNKIGREFSCPIVLVSAKNKI